MTAQTSSISNTRLDALVVGSTDMAVQFELALKTVVNAAAVQRFDDYMLAMGHLASQTADDPDAISPSVDIVVGDLSRMQDPAGPTSQALRQLAPGAKLIVLAEPDQQLQARQAVAAGFDEYFLGPPSARQIIDAAGLTPRAAETPSPASTETPLATASPDHPLGDVDLVENILTGQKGLADMAVRLIRQQSGLTAADFVADGQQVPADHLAAEVKMARQLYGFLHAPEPATQDELAPWAAWMSRWLALDARVTQLQHMAMRDELTGAFNRRYFNRFLKRTLDRAGEERFNVTLMVFDIDDFKIYNDKYGHSAGDEILIEAARLMKSMVREHDVVARIGGDEFAVIFWDAEEPRGPKSDHPATVHTVAKRFQKAICEKAFPKLAEEAPGTLTVSAGLAGFPWDGRTPEELLELADQMAIQSKRNGKNAITLGPGVAMQCNGG